MILDGRKAIYEELHPETKHGANQHTRGVENFATPADRFTAATANATGKSERAVRMASARGEALGDDLGAVTGTSLDKGVELDALAKMPKDERNGPRNGINWTIRWVDTYPVRHMYLSV